VSRKANLKGIGKDNDEYKFSWWDNMYNQSSSNLQIITDNGNVAFTQMKSNPAVSATPVVDPLMAMFVKPGAETESNPAPILSMNMEDAELFKLCEGRTAHKGARANVVGKILRSDAELGAKLENALGATKMQLRKSEKRKRKASEKDPDPLPERVVTKENSDAPSTETQKTEKKEKKAKKQSKEKKKKKKKEKQDKSGNSSSR
jgi:outer membrane biosynthesis protein TonB